MKRRPDSTTSERELIGWLAEGGRILALGALAGWRKHGLLPPLDSCGTGAGRAYYWRDPLIRRRARAAFDLMERTSHVDQTLWGLWLRGFPVPAAKLKRAWQHGTRLRRPWLPVADLADRHDKARCSKETLLTEVTRMLGRTLPTDRRIVAVLEDAGARLGRAAGLEGASGAHLWSLLQMAGLALESSALLDCADDALLTKAQRHLNAAAILLDDCSNETDAWDTWLADRIGPFLALVVLAMLQSGQAEILDALAHHLEAPGRRIPPARPSLWQVTA